MEVHTHSHTPRKKWTHYFWEFLMLFFAVFCGFLAENQREHFVEHQREKQYMQSMVEDLVLDTAELSFIMNHIDSNLLPVLSVSKELLFHLQFSDSMVKKMYEYVPRSSRFLALNIEDRTMNQLKSSGNLRLIRNKAVTDSLAAYWKVVDLLNNTLIRSYDLARIEVKNISYSLFNFDYYTGNNPVLPLIKDARPKLVSEDKKEFIKLANFISNLHSQAAFSIRDKLKDAKEKATNLIDLIKEKYHFQ